MALIGDDYKRNTRGFMGVGGRAPWSDSTTPTRRHHPIPFAFKPEHEEWVDDCFTDTKLQRFISACRANKRQDMEE